MWIKCFTQGHNTCSLWGSNPLATAVVCDVKQSTKKKKKKNIVQTIQQYPYTWVHWCMEDDIGWHEVERGCVLSTTLLLCLPH